MKRKVHVKSCFSVALVQRNILKWNVTSWLLLIEGTKRALEDNCSDRMFCFGVQYNKWGEGFSGRLRNDMLKEY